MEIFDPGEIRSPLHSTNRYDNVRNLLRRQEPLRNSVCSFLSVHYMIDFRFFLSLFPISFYIVK